MISNNPILVIAAHPDDETLGCGGAIAKYASMAVPVYVLILSYMTIARGHNVENKKGQISDAMDTLGVQDVFIRSFNDQLFDTFPLIEIAKSIKEIVNHIKPSTVFTHHIGDLNQDHRIVAQATMIATRPVPGQCVKTLLSYEVPSSTEWSFGQFKPFNPNFVVDISGFVDRKIEALQVYENEMRDSPHPRSPEAIRAYATMRGSAVGSHASEAFELIRCI